MKSFSRCFLSSNGIRFVLAFCSTAGVAVLAGQTELSDGEAEGIALEAIDGVVFDWRQEAMFSHTNGMTVVTFPRYYFPGDNPTNPPDHAAVVWIDDSTRTVVSNPGLIPLSDEQAISIATNGNDIAFDSSKPISVIRIASLTMVSLPRQDRTVYPGFVYTNGYAAQVWIDTETQTVLGVEVEAD